MNSECIVDRHAYCIMAHGNWTQLQILLNCIDDYRNDIYLHIDAKGLKSFNNWGGKLSCNFSKLTCIESEDVRWSDISQTDVEVNLFKKVIEGGRYNYVHLLSGSDLPLKSQDEIHDFFEGRHEEFVDIQQNDDAVRRLKYYHYFVRWRKIYPWLDVVRKTFLLVQMPFVNRLRNCPLPFAYGANWCSLTGNAVVEIVNKYKELRSFFKYTTSSDESYKQMILLGNGNFEIAKEGFLRFVKFGEGEASPKILTMDYYENMMDSGCLFARKFDIRIDNNVVNKVLQKLKYK